MATTIKAKLLADLQQHSDSRGRVSLSPEALAKRQGLNGHDLVKNLDQLRQEGLLEMTWRNDRIARIRLRRGALNESLLREKPTLSVAERVRQWLIRQPTQFGGWVIATPADVIAGLGIPDSPSGANPVNPAISEMARRGILQVRKEGRRIVAIRVPPAGAPKPLAGSEEPSAPTRTVPPTPALDAYIAARRMARLAPAHNPYLQLTFEPNPLGEEAEQLRDTLRAVLGAKEGEPQ